MEQSTQPRRSSDPNRVRNAILWILSGPILLIAVSLFQLIIHFIGATPSIIKTIINLISVLAGTAGILLIPVGPIVGIIKLSRR